MHLTSLPYVPQEILHFNISELIYYVHGVNKSKVWLSACNVCLQNVIKTKRKWGFDECICLSFISAFQFTQIHVPYLVASVAFLSSQCLRSLQLRITISKCNPRVRLLSAGNFEDVTSFCEGFPSLGIWYLLVTSQKNGDLNFIALKTSKLSRSYPPLKITFFYDCEFIFPFQSQAKYFLPPSFTDLRNNSGLPLLSAWIKNPIMWWTHRLVLHVETVWGEMERVRATKWRNVRERVNLHILCDQTRVDMSKKFLKQNVVMRGSYVLP